MKVQLRYEIPFNFLQIFAVPYFAYFLASTLLAWAPNAREMALNSLNPLSIQYWLPGTLFFLTQTKKSKAVMAAVLWASLTVLPEMASGYSFGEMLARIHWYDQAVLILWMGFTALLSYDYQARKPAARQASA